ncbi:MAG TPA: sigma-70 family RNA polymerase sigma factor [Chryseolinea sp.]
MEEILRHRRLLFSIAYNILGEVHEAEDIVQDIYEHWFAKQPTVGFPKAYLSKAVVTKSIDRLAALKKDREHYKGPWLPVPLIDENFSLNDEEPTDPLPYALLTVLEKLNPVERAAFILRRAFDHSYAEISEMCNMNEESVRQLIHRAHEKLLKPRVRYTVADPQRERLLIAFLQACRTRDSRGLKEILHQDVIMYSDGGGKASAAVVPLKGATKIINFLMKVLDNVTVRFDMKIVTVNGAPGAILFDKTSGKIDTVMTFQTEDEKIVDFYFVRNPDKILRPE